MLYMHIISFSGYSLDRPLLCFIVAAVISIIIIIVIIIIVPSPICPSHHRHHRHHPHHEGIGTSPTCAKARYGA